MLSIWLAGAALLLPALAPTALAAEGLSLTTPYPAVEVTPGTDISIDLTVDADEPARVALALVGVPSTWTAELRGGGYVVNAVQVDGSEPTTVRLDIEVPDNATGTTTITVRATSTGTTVELPIEVTTREGAGGTVELTTDAPALEGPSDDTFTFSVQIRNDKEEDVTFIPDASGPTPEWDVTARGTAQGQSVSGTVRAGSATTIEVSVTPPDDTPAGTYPISLVVTAAGETLQQDLEVVVTGSYSMTLTTPTRVLSGRGSAGALMDQQWTITNTGTAPLTDVSITANPPSDWTVTFEPASIASIAPGEEQTITAHITPSGDAIAGDYSMTFRGQSEEADDVTATYRFTVETSILGAIIGAGLIALVFGGLFWVFRRYGRR